MATTNITFGIIGNYCYFPYLVTTGSYVTNFTYSPENTAALDGYTYYVYFSDLAAVVAIETINTLNIFPGVHINVKRFSDCGAYWPTVENDFQGATGGFASSIMMHDILEAHNDVVAVIGLEYSSTARGPAEVLSTNRYRTALDAHKATRVALVIEKGDDLSTQYAADIFSTLQKQGITILATPRITSAMGPTQVQYVRKVLMEVDARYIILCFQSYLGSVLYQQLSELGGVVDENHVWITYSRIALTATNSTTIKQYQNQRGIVYLQNPPPSDNTRWFQTFFSGMQSMGYASNSTFNVWEVQYDTFTANIFDCGMMLALGMKQVLQTVPGATREMLSNKALNGYANFSVFRDLGYEGLMGTPYNILNNNGDLDTPYQFYSFTGNYIYVIQTNSCARRL
ncbi:periplasmic binding protein-like I [Rhizoclosmatium globosum]|uniref:Periplasmic binding protein-like I n=1 Tax=Rhizoclosmatium globosum TaxID=329046 RepID=A0A1Y2CW61_9FUNG|nr:periplasmic binding protein-like I [Rhizoclosmatium globosum]|eukprot:ORY51263.1 periplasmic binding protein-like I [Rhizoclosmatium globosum]